MAFIWQWITSDETVIQIERIWNEPFFMLVCSSSLTMVVMETSKTRSFLQFESVSGATSRRFRPNATWPLLHSTCVCISTHNQTVVNDSETVPKESQMIDRNLETIVEETLNIQKSILGATSNESISTTTDENGRHVEFPTRKINF